MHWTWEATAKASKGSHAVVVPTSILTTCRLGPGQFSFFSNLKRDFQVDISRDQLWSLARRIEQVANFPVQWQPGIFFCLQTGKLGSFLILVGSQDMFLFTSWSEISIFGGNQKISCLLPNWEISWFLVRGGVFKKCPVYPQSGNFPVWGWKGNSLCALFPSMRNCPFHPLTGKFSWYLLFCVCVCGGGGGIEKCQFATQLVYKGKTIAARFAAEISNFSFKT